MCARLDEGRADTRISLEVVVREVGVRVIQSDDPLVGQRIVDAGADGPASVCPAKRRGTKGGRVIAAVMKVQKKRRHPFT